MIRSTPAAAFAALALAATATSALAHAKLVRSTPAANATVTAPKQIVLTFSEKMHAKLSGADVIMPQMNNMAVAADTAVAKDGLTIVVTPAKPLTAGAYQVKWHAVTSDSHRVEGSLAFAVR
jgi:methionine-rich copper-binding protein CopC